VEEIAESGLKFHTTPHVARRTGRGFYFFNSEGNLLRLDAPHKTSANETRSIAACPRLARALWYFRDLSDRRRRTVFDQELYG
jgi:hypothetical protein